MDDSSAAPSRLPGLPVSLWLDTTPGTSHPRLMPGVKVDVAVIGGGIAGLMTAALLKEAGRTVAVVEARRIAQSVTGNTTAKITSQHHLRYARMLKNFGDENTWAYARANQDAIGFIADMASRYGIDCDFTPASAYVYTLDPGETGDFEREAEAARSVGLPAEFTERAPLPFSVAAAVRFSDQARFHPRKFLLGLAQHIPGDGSHIFEQTRVMEVEDGSPCRVVTPHGELLADEVVVASHFPFGDRGSYTLRLKPKRSLVLGVLPERPLPEGLDRSMLISTDPMHSLRTQEWQGRQMLLVGGGSHKTGQADAGKLYLELEGWTRMHFGEHDVVYRWATQDNVTLDDVPYTGRLSPGSRHVYVTTGYGGWGMTNSVASAVLLRDLIMGRDNPAAAVYGPGRIKLDGLGQLVREGADAMKHLVVDRFRSVDPQSIPVGSGGIVKDGVSPVALYRAEDGTEFRMSATCTHLGCVVNWNDSEKSWDCPCHGSRYNAVGEVLQGPAVEPLPDLQRKGSGQ